MSTLVRPLRNPLIFDRPHLLPWRKRVLWGLVTIAFWLAWIYLWLPLITVIAWAFGLYTAYDQLITFKGWQELAKLLIYYLAVIVMLGGGLLFWAAVQWWRFRGKERRQAPVTITPACLAQRYQLDIPHLEQCQRAQRLVVDYDQHGKLVLIKVLADHEAGPKPQDRRRSA